MIFRMITVLILGIGIGSFITSIQVKNEREVSEELMTLYEKHEEELKDRINYYKNGMNETLKQNIDLKRRLNNGNSSRV